MLKKPLDRIGYGGYLSLAAKFPDFVEEVEHIADEFREIFSAHDFIISKGMGNYEGLTEIDLSSKEVFFLLCSKCTTISKNIGVNLHDMLLLKNRN